MQLYSVCDEYISYLREKNLVVERCLDFQALEKECDKWIQELAVNQIRGKNR